MRQLRPQLVRGYIFDTTDHAWSDSATVLVAVNVNQDVRDYRSPRTVVLTIRVTSCRSKDDPTVGMITQFKGVIWCVGCTLQKGANTVALPNGTRVQGELIVSDALGIMGWLTDRATACQLQPEQYYKRGPHKPPEENLPPG